MRKTRQRSTAGTRSMGGGRLEGIRLCQMGWFGGRGNGLVGGGGVRGGGESGRVPVGYDGSAKGGEVDQGEEAGDSVALSSEVGCFCPPTPSHNQELDNLVLVVTSLGRGFLTFVIDFDHTNLRLTNQI